MSKEDRLDETETLLRRLDVLERLRESSASVHDLFQETDQSRTTINRAVNELETVGLVERGADGLEATTAGRLAHDRLETFLGDLDDSPATSREDRLDETETLLRRLDVLERLRESPVYVRDLAEETEQSRTTINRAINELELSGLVERSGDGLEATTAGRLAHDRLETFLGDLDDILTAKAVLDPIPPEADVAPGVVADCEAILSVGPVHYRPLERIHDDLADATRYRALLPSLVDPRHVRLLYEHVVTQGRPAELVVAPEVFETLREEFPRRVAAMAEEDGFSVRVGTVPPIGLGLFERESPDSRNSTTTAHVVVFTEKSGVHGLLVNDADRAVQWVEERYAASGDDATDRTETLIPGSDGGVRSLGTGDGGAAAGQPVPVSLEREGFAGIGVPYFRDEPVADPATAWRAGLSLAEVHTGYAVPRPADGVGPDESLDEDGDLASTITDELTAGGDCVVVGPPGSGKSTLCKAVACEWYDADRGPVLYREHDHGRSFASVEDLVAIVGAADGHALVVVEDAVRPDTERIFEAVDRLGDRSDVSFLLDARETEWQEYADRSSVASKLRVLHVPPTNEQECERLVEHFERTTGRSVDVPADQLWAAVRDETAPGGGGTHEMLRLIHRLATYADPLADGPTALEDAVASVYDAIADDEVTLSVCILANTLNAAGGDVDRGPLYAVAVDEEFDADDDVDALDAGDDVDALDAVDAALDRLEGTVLFPREDGRYRTVHEEWSATFLAHLVDVDEDAGTQRFGAAVNALLALADDHERCDRIANHLDDPRELADVVDDPTSWADEVVESVYVVGRTRSKLAPLFGDGEHDSIDIPDACSGGVADERPIWLGRMFLAGGYYDRAEGAFERLPREDAVRGPERLLGLARVAHERGEYDDAIDCCRECLSLVETETEESDVRETETEESDVRKTEDELLGIRARVRIGDALTERGEFDDAETHYETALDGVRATGTRGWEARTLHRLGRVEMGRGEFDRAREYYEASLEIRHELGDRRGQAETLNFMGNVAWKRGEYDRAAELFERSLEIRRELGDRPDVAASLNNLGVIAGQRGDFDRATELYERSLELRRQLGDRQGVAKCLHNLGHLEALQDNLDRASELYERSLEIKREIGDRPHMTDTLTNLGVVEGKRGNYDRAAALHEQCLDIRQEMGDRHGVKKALRNLGLIERRRGTFDRAAELSEQSLELGRELDVPPGVASSLLDLGTIAVRRGYSDRAREYCEDALEIATDVDDADQLAQVHLLLGEVALQEGALDRARGHFEEALEVADREKMLGLQIRLARSRLALLDGDLDRARTIAREVTEAFAEIGAVHWIARSERLLGRIAVEAGEDDTAREHLLDALDAFEEIGALHDALTTLEALVETFPGDDEAVEQWLERGRGLSAEAPEEVGERHRTWLDRTIA